MELRSNIDLVIDELDLTGVPPSRRHQVAATFERELLRLLVTRGLPAVAEDGAPVHDGDRELQLTLPLDANPVMLGYALAASVYEGLR